MKRIFCFLGLLSVAFLCAQTMLAQTSTLVPLRILTYNIRHGADMHDVMNLDRQATIIKDCEADVVGLQEVDSVTSRSGKVNEAAYLAEKCGMSGVFGRAIDYGGGKYGVAILSKETPLSVKNIPLPGAEKRTLLVCEFENYVFACTHLDLVESNRMASMNIIVEEAAKWDKTFFICGDWNDVPDSKLLTALKKKFVIMSSTTNGLSYPADAPTKCIDYVACYGRNAYMRNSVVLNEPEASDHRPVLVDVMYRIKASGVDSPDETGQNAEIFDLWGRKVAHPEKLAKGVYITKGRKMLKR